MKIKKRIFSLALAGALTMGLLPAFSSPALAAEVDSSYTLTIPSTLTVANSGWNATDGISATGTLADGKQLTITASSDNEWNLKSGENLIAYKIASATEQDNSYSDATAITSLTISADQLNNGTYSAPFGIVVDDYTDKPAGEYKDTVTFTAVVSAPKKLTLTGEYYDYNTENLVEKSLEIEYTDNDTWKDIAERYDEVSLVDNSYGPSEDKVVMFWHDESQGIGGLELKSNESTYNFNLVSINDKVSAYSSYFLDG